MCKGIIFRNVMRLEIIENKLGYMVWFKWG